MVKLMNFRSGIVPSVSIASTTSIVKDIKNGYPYILPVYHNGLYLPYNATSKTEGLYFKGRFVKPQMLGIIKLCKEDLGTAKEKQIYPENVWSDETEEHYVILDVIRCIVYLANRNELYFVYKTMLLFNNIPIIDLQFVNGSRVWYATSNLGIKE